MQYTYQSKFKRVVYMLALISYMSPVSCNHIRWCKQAPVSSEGPGHLFVISSCDLCLLSVRWGARGGKKVCSDLLVISQCPPPSRWTTSGKSQHLAGQGGPVITAELQTSLRIDWKIQCRATSPPRLINLPSSSAKHHHQRLISSLLANTMRLPDIKAVLMNKLGMVYGGLLCANLQLQPKCGCYFSSSAT